MWIMSAFDRCRFTAICVAVLVSITALPDARIARAQSIQDMALEQSSSTVVPSTTIDGAAKWLVQSTFVASSIESGRIGYIEAWGGDEFGYSYDYSLSGEPKGLS